MRAALKGLVHELYFKCTHFPGLKGYSPRSAHDLAMQQLDEAGAVVVSAAQDPVTSLLHTAHSRIPPTKTSRDLLQRWECAESTLNARVRIIFGLLGRHGASALLSDLHPIFKDLPPLSVSPGRNPLGGRRADRRIGQPDLVLQTAEAAVTIEMKVRGSQARAKYDHEQHLKYLRLAAELHANARGRFRSAHVLLAPLNSGRVVQTPSAWLRGPILDGAFLEIDAVHMLDRLSTRRSREVVNLGGIAWLERWAREMPTVVVELKRFLQAAAEAACGTEGICGPAIRQQVEYIRQFGVAEGSAA